LYVPYAVAIADLNLGQVELLAGRFDLAAEHLERSERRLEEMSARSGRIHLFRLARLAHGAGTGNWTRFDELLAPYRHGWPEDARLVGDHPWLLEMTGGYAYEAGETERARRVRQLARELWDELGDQQAVDRLDELLDG